MMPIIRMYGQDVFQMPKRQVARVEVRRPASYYYDHPDKEVMTLVQGKMPGSIEEWRFAMGLQIVGMKFYFQYSVGGGGYGLAGGQILDFLLKTAPLRTPVYIQGAYWHYQGDRAYTSQYKIAQLMHDYRGQYAKPIEVDTRKLTSVPAAVEVIRFEGVNP